ncbi:tyrosine-type recombinase/integrase [uncultured Dysosmobacter sp.]|uniref:tyrosine-type recombinase/integrase n=1 Tax=uncultured Dysosmobacter sp. TaxID=2591384 RepID=UPI003441FE97
MRTKEHICFHDLRRTFATLMFWSGAEPKTASEMLDHYPTEHTLAYAREETSIKIVRGQTPVLK